MNTKIAMNNSYAVIDGILEKVHFKSFYYDAETKDVVYTLEDGRTLLNLITYVSPQAFEDGQSNCLELDYDRYPSKCKYWRFKDGEPVEEEVFVKYCKYTKIIPNGYYQTRAECLGNNSYVENTNGEFIKHTCVAEKITLKNIQIDLIEKLEDVLKECANNNIKFLFDSMTFNIIPYNNHEDICVVYCDGSKPYVDTSKLKPLSVDAIYVGEEDGLCPK